MTDSSLVLSLSLPTSPVHMVLDTDTKCEVDDQFALAYAIRSAELGQLVLEAVYAAPFPKLIEPGHWTGGAGMEASYEEIGRVIGLTHTKLEVPCFRGSEHFFREAGPCESEAARDLIARAMARPAGDPLYVVCIGAITNLANALRMEPALAEHIVVLFLGTNDLHFPHCEEYNYRNDPEALDIVMMSGAPLILFPARRVVSHLITTNYELEHFLLGKSDIGTYLCGIVREYGLASDRTPEEDYAWSKVVWDVVGVAFLTHPEWFVTSLVPMPLVAKGPDGTNRWMEDPTRPLMRLVEFVERDPVFTDLFRKLGHD